MGNGVVESACGLAGLALSADGGAGSTHATALGRDAVDFLRLFCTEEQSARAAVVDPVGITWRGWRDTCSWIGAIEGVRSRNDADAGVENVGNRATVKLKASDAMTTVLLVIFPPQETCYPAGQQPR